MRQAELDATRANLYTAIAEVPYLSKRFALKRFLGMTPEEIAENERLWQEENAGTLTPANDAAGELRSAGITPSSMAADAETQAAEAPPEMEAGAAETDTGGAEAPEAPTE